MLTDGVPVTGDDAITAIEETRKRESPWATPRLFKNLTNVLQRSATTSANN
jgi:hypothetical protein